MARDTEPHTGAHTGPRALRAARSRSGLSQEALAERARVSERTVRSLESGAAKRPHRDTLAAISTALGLDETQSRTFLALWRAGERTLADSFGDTTRDDVFHADFAALRAGIRDRTVRIVASVRPDRTWSSCRTQRVFQAVADGVDTFAWTFGQRSQSAADVATLSTSRNLELVSRVDLADAPATMFVASLGTALRTGDLHTVSYGFDIESVAGAPDATEPDVESLFSVLVPIDVLELQVRFDPAALPRRVWQVRRSTIDGGGDLDAGRDLPVSPFGVVSLIEIPAAAGVHGIRWDWGDDA